MEVKYSYYKTFSCAKKNKRINLYIFKSKNICYVKRPMHIYPTCDAYNQQRGKRQNIRIYSY